MKNQISVIRIIVAIFCCAMPLLCLCVGIYYVFCGAHPHPLFLIGYFLFPVTAIMSFWLAIFVLKNMMSRYLLFFIVFFLYYSVGIFFVIVAPVDMIESVKTDVAIDSIRCLIGKTG